MTEKVDLAVIGGSGLYHMSGLKEIHEFYPDTPFGKPSAPILIGKLAGRGVAFLARHGAGHHISPSEVPYRANIFALKQLGVERIVSISACGSLREDYAPGHIVIPDQLFDNTRNRPRTFFEEGLVAHIGAAEPFCADLSKQLERAVRETGASVHSGGALITIEGPRFSTRAESNVFREWRMSLIGMTACPEAFLAREAEICYAAMAHVTDYDVWHVAEAPVSVEIVIETLKKNTEIAQEALVKLVEKLDPTRNCDCSQALAGALITDRENIPAATIARLNPLLKKYIAG
jgi:5'-methylthioadenosine phosphorylase